MIYIHLPESAERKLSFYLAMEEYVARHVDHDDCFFMWQVSPSVIFGRNQVIENEVDVNYCQAHGINIYRRKSGGGCVYADHNNLMLSYITKDENVNFTFNRYINMLLLVLWKAGIEATATGRNDIMIGEQKVSGNAFYHIPGRSIVHGTLLYDTVMENMMGAITPSHDKLESKGVKSVRQHIALLKDYTEMNIDELKAFIITHLCDSSYHLLPSDVEAIGELSKEYEQPSFIYGKSPAYTTHRHERIDGVGEFDLMMTVRHGVIKDINLMGDFFLVGDLDEGILHPLLGVALTSEALSAALPDRLDDIILHLHKQAFISLLLGTTSHTCERPTNK